jgi:hypothetical protein
VTGLILIGLVLVIGLVAATAAGPTRRRWQRQRDKRAVLQAQLDGLVAQQVVRQLARQAQVEMLRIVWEHRQGGDRR